MTQFRNRPLEERINKVGVGWMLTDIGINLASITGGVMLVYGTLAGNDNLANHGWIPFGVGLVYGMGKHVGKRMYGEK